MPAALDDLATRFLSGQKAALSRAISLVERQDPRAPGLLRRLRPHARAGGPSVGFTGAPGAGKSSLVDAYIRVARGAGRSIAVLAVDPSSPVSGGAVLGDRLRMDEHILDPQVYIRSMGARGHLGGLSTAAAEAAWLLGAFGFNEVVVETVGTGQSEIEVATLVDTTVVVLTPGMGDSVQVEKAGIMEVADVYAVNKADLPGARAVARDLRTMVNMGPDTGWRPPIVLTIAHPPDASAETLTAAVLDHRTYLAGTAEGRRTADERRANRVAALVAQRAHAWALAQLGPEGPTAGELLAEELPSLIADRLLEGTTM